MQVSVPSTGSGTDISRRDWMRTALASILFPFIPGSNYAQLSPALAMAAAWAGNKLLDQTFAFVSGEIMSVAFGQPGISDVKGWVQNSVAEVESNLAKLSARIDTDNMNVMSSRLESLKHQFMEYVSLEVTIQPQNRVLLANCDSLSAELVPLSQRYDQAFFVSTVAMGYRLATLFALYNLDKGKNNSGSGHISALVSSGEISTYFRKAIASRSRIMVSMRPDRHFSLQCSYEPSPLPFKGPTTSCQVLKDENPVASSGPMQWDSGLTREEVREKTHVKAAPLLGAAMKKPTVNYQSFREQSQKQIQLVWQCFDRMYWTACNVRYQAPDELTRLPDEWDLIELPSPTKWVK